MPAPPPPPAPPNVPQLPDNGVTSVTKDPRIRAAAAYGAGSTDVTGPQGLTTPPSTTAKTLLGS
jgi:hypothetical protein